MNTPKDVEGRPTLDVETMGRDGPESRAGERLGHVEGERGIPPVNRVRSMQARVTAVLAIGCMSVIAVGLLGWYYSRTLTRGPRAAHSAQATSQEHARGEMTLPPLGPIERPRTMAPALSSPTAPPSETPSALQEFLGPPPALPANVAPQIPGNGASPGMPSVAPRVPPGTIPIARQLRGPVFTSDLARKETPAEAASMATPIHTGELMPATSMMAPPGAPASASGNLEDRLRVSLTPAVQAQVLPTQRFLLPKGAFLDCTLESAIDSTLPGLVTCVTATDSFGVDGMTVLIERGSKLVGETQGDVHQGAARVFVLWTQVRTPTGVVVALGSPGTDELGRAGLPGEVNRHFFQRFGAAMLISIIEGAVQGAAQRSNGAGTVVVSPSGTEAIPTEVLKSTVNIPPTLTKDQGDRIQVLVARDLDFRSVYELRSIGAR